MEMGKTKSTSEILCGSPDLASTDLWCGSFVAGDLKSATTVLPLSSAKIILLGLFVDVT
jgi:hypothetical protein